jgi:hypothetical protein
VIRRRMPESFDDDDPTPNLRGDMSREERQPPQATTGEFRLAELIADAIVKQQPEPKRNNGVLTSVAIAILTAMVLGMIGIMYSGLKMDITKESATKDELAASKADLSATKKENNEAHAEIKSDVSAIKTDLSDIRQVIVENQPPMKVRAARNRRNNP